ncbi:hypothetical protein SBOR_9529 [Sclerotinia borealis F-4128]|uniref:Uncharacterized protein n=1 Tax=Sclerotinia borealis (strain F-4128) TaxID=1432307 RepID=W9C2Z4_SCLBF|nr:hypothetical protein SBOR_9529 [Sclerotinia borealis F-4128]
MSHDRPRPRSRGYFERDGHIHERITLRSPSRSRSRSHSHPHLHPHHRSSSQPRLTTREIANELEERNAELHAITTSLHTELATLKGKNWQLICDNGEWMERVRILKVEKEKLKRENREKEREVGELVERVGLMRRGVVGRGILVEEGLRERLEEMVVKVEGLEERVRVLNGRVKEKDSKLDYLRRWLVAKGYRVEGV